jgi:hypothetical protein
MPATIRISYYGANASEPAGATAESGFKYNLADSLSGTTPVVKPAATGTAFSFVKQLALEVTGTFASTIGTLQVKLGSSLTSGLTVGFLGHATYLNQTGGTGAGSDSGSNGAVPSGYTAMTTTYQTYDATTGISVASTGRKGTFCRVAAGVDNTYAGGASSATAMPDHSIQYTET